MEKRLKYKIDIFGDTYTVTFKDKVYNSDGKWVFGETCTDKFTIDISTHTEDNVALSNEQIRITLLHEIAHALCFAGCYIGYGEDEPFIEFVAKSLNSLIKQKILCLGEKNSNLE